MTSTRHLSLLVLACLAGGAQAAGDGCDPSGGLEFVCGPKNAEDLVLVPGTQWIIASSLEAGAGLYLIDSRDATWSTLRPEVEHDPAFPDCTTPPPAATSSTHGLSLRAGAGGRSTLYAVGHGPREAIEVFDVDASGAMPVIRWKGCVPMPAGLEANSVAFFADGSLVATVFAMPGKTLAEALAGKPTGAVFDWSSGRKGFELVRGTELPGNNGIEVSADGREIFVASVGLRTVVAFSRTHPAQQLRATERLPFVPDNLHQDASGQLLTAGMKDDEPACGGVLGPQHDIPTITACPRGFFAMAIDPATMKGTVIAQGPANPAFNVATMVLTVGPRFWLGTFRGDRIGHGRLR